MVREEQLLEVIKKSKESDKERKFNQSVEMIMVFRDIDVKKGFAINEIIQLPRKMSKPASVGINRDPKLKEQIHKKLLEIPETVYLYEVTGRFDIILRIYTKDLENLHSVVMDKIGKIDGIQNTETFVELQKTDKDPYYLTKNIKKSS